MEWRDWWPDWSGETVVIAASGPSQNAADLSLCRGVKVMAINETWRLAPFCDVLYACDARWWRVRGPQIDCLKVSGEPHEGCHNVNAKDWIPKGGNNSGYQALALAMAWGARRVILTGYDMQGTHWHGRHEGNNPNEGHFRRWVKAFAEMTTTCEVLNASRVSRITAFPKVTLEEALGVEQHPISRTRGSVLRHAQVRQHLG